MFCHHSAPLRKVSVCWIEARSFSLHLPLSPRNVLEHLVTLLFSTMFYHVKMQLPVCSLTCSASVPPASVPPLCLNPSALAESTCLASAFVSLRYLGLAAPPPSIFHVGVLKPLCSAGAVRESCGRELPCRQSLSTQTHRLQQFTATE